MNDQTITEPGEQDTEVSPGLVRRAADGLRSGLTGHAAIALRTGSVLLITKGWALTAPNASIWERLGYVGLAGYAVTYTATDADLGPAAPFIVPSAALAWCVAAWTIAPPPDRTASEAHDTPDEPEGQADDEEDGLPDREFVVALVRKVAAGQQGAHLEDLLATGEFGPLSKADLKTLLTDDYDLPVESFGIRVDGHKRTRDGVRLRHLPRGATEPPPERTDEAPAESAPGDPV